MIQGKYMEFVDFTINYDPFSVECKDEYFKQCLLDYRIYEVIDGLATAIGVDYNQFYGVRVLSDMRMDYSPLEFEEV